MVVLLNPFSLPLQTISHSLYFLSIAFCTVSTSKKIQAFLFFYILFKGGICQCIGRSLCKLCSAACEAYWHALEDITCFLRHKLKNTKRINRCRQRRRGRCHFEDMEQGYDSIEGNALADNYHHLNNVSRKYNVRSRRRKGSFISSSGYGFHGHLHHRVRLKSREVGIYVKGESRRRRSSRQMQISKIRNVQRQAKISRRRDYDR